MLIVLVVLLVELHSSVTVVTALGSSPPKANPAVAPEVYPDPPRPTLPVDKSATSAQLVPFQSSVLATIVVVFPPKTMVAVFLPLHYLNRLLLSMQIHSKILYYHIK